MIQCAKCKKYRAGHISTTYLGFSTKICFSCATDPKFSRHGESACFTDDPLLAKHISPDQIERDATTMAKSIRKGDEFTLSAYRRLDGRPYVFIAA